jgi:hypothetical protein
MDIEPIYDFLCCVHTWWLNGQLHRIDGPAFEDNNEKRWYTEGKLHRLDGPAIIAGNYMEWRRDGVAKGWVKASRGWPFTYNG